MLSCSSSPSRPCPGRTLLALHLPVSGSAVGLFRGRGPWGRRRRRTRTSVSGHRSGPPLPTQEPEGQLAQTRQTHPLNRVTYKSCRFRDSESRSQEFKKGHRMSVATVLKAALAALGILAVYGRWDSLRQLLYNYLYRRVRGCWSPALVQSRACFDSCAVAQRANRIRSRPCPG